MDESRKRILEAILVQYREKDLKFTMDDIASQLHMSKKTIYRIYRDKEEMLSDMVDYMFDIIRSNRKQYKVDCALSIPEKLRKMMGGLPDSYQDMDFNKLYILSERYPKVYAKINSMMQKDWNEIMDLIREGQKEGSIREVSVDSVALLIEAFMEKLLSTNTLEKTGVDYRDAMNTMLTIVMDGLIK
ncbi:TetR/AcrR family transcriptional regulator [Butyrivibrio sp. MC2013]|uniref:TetR/AcrR family transcriptional regulator n=1 Tax=Butyrivibrio sp. MC2013 TaxID=1280686 RepID=UPI00041FD509|nr:TetR/AcrR family transcriptional regulator [Butyrivibrio sp. MC2013]